MMVEKDIQALQDKSFLTGWAIWNRIKTKRAVTAAEVVAGYNLLASQLVQLERNMREGIVAAERTKYARAELELERELREAVHGLEIAKRKAERLLVEQAGKRGMTVENHQLVLVFETTEKIRVASQKELSRSQSEIWKSELQHAIELKMKEARQASNLRIKEAKVLSSLRIEESVVSSNLRIKEENKASSRRIIEQDNTTKNSIKEGDRTSVRNIAEANNDSKNRIKEGDRTSVRSIIEGDSEAQREIQIYTAKAQADVKKHEQLSRSDVQKDYDMRMNQLKGIMAVKLFSYARLNELRKIYKDVLLERYEIETSRLPASVKIPYLNLLDETLFAYREAYDVGRNRLFKDSSGEEMEGRDPYALLTGDVEAGREEIGDEI